jgi:hypothetical protein
VRTQAAKGDARALASLTPPESPEWLDYLRTWLYKLHGHSGGTGMGPAPLSYGTIADFARLCDVDIDPSEVDWLMMADGILLAAHAPPPPKKATEQGD